MNLKIALGASAALMFALSASTLNAQNGTSGPNPVGVRNDCTFVRGISTCLVTTVTVSSEDVLADESVETEATGAPRVEAVVGDLDMSGIETHSQGCPAGQGGVGDRFKGFGVQSTTTTTSQQFERWLVRDWETLTTTATDVTEIRHRGAPGSDGLVLSMTPVSSTSNTAVTGSWTTRTSNGTYWEVMDVDTNDARFGQNGFTAECYLTPEAYLAAFGAN